MPTNEERPVVRVVCTECPFEVVVEKGGERPAEVIVDHGRETGHTLTTEELRGSE